MVPNCSKTMGAISVADPEGKIYYCAQRLFKIESQYPSASNFFILHEYGHIRLQTGDEHEVDCWTSVELSKSRKGKETITSVTNFLKSIKNIDKKYGRSGRHRAELILGCYTQGKNFLSKWLKN